jgi:hypothetical protein
MRLPPQRLVLAAQATYFLVTGLWALVSYRTFEAVTGRKRDDWLVKTLAAFIIPVGAALALAARRPEPSPEARLLAAGSATALGLADLIYVLRGRIPRIYLLDSVAEAVLIVALFATGRNRGGNHAREERH